MLHDVATIAIYIWLPTSHLLYRLRYVVIVSQGLLSVIEYMLGRPQLLPFEMKILILLLEREELVVGVSLAKSQCVVTFIAVIVLHPSFQEAKEDLLELINLIGSFSPLIDELNLLTRFDFTVLKETVLCNVPANS